MTEIEPQQPSGVSRRTVTKAMAWAVPVIAVAAPIPAFAASVPVVVIVPGSACKAPGNSQGIPNGQKGYYIAITITNSTAAPITVDLLSLNVNGVLSSTAITTTNPPVNTSTVVVQPNTKCTLTVLAYSYPDSANGTATLNYEVNNVGGTTPGVSLAEPLPPIQGGQCTLTFPNSVCSAA